ncbi:MAG: hypothetical protein C0478_02345 [Planctomyces sp.]|nr:hypothetical protein [Planctomyces sp.]
MWAMLSLVAERAWQAALMRTRNTYCIGVIWKSCLNRRSNWLMDRLTIPANSRIEISSCEWARTWFRTSSIP